MDIVKKLGITNIKAFLMEMYSDEVFKTFVFFPNVIFNNILWDEIVNLTTGIFYYYIFFISSLEAMNKDLYCKKDLLLHSGFCNLGSNYSDFNNIAKLLIQPHSNWKFTEKNYVIYDINILSKIIEYVTPYVLEQAKIDASEIYKQLKTIKKSVQLKKQTNLEVI